MQSFKQYRALGKRVEAQFNSKAKPNPNPLDLCGDGPARRGPFHDSRETDRSNSSSPTLSPLSNDVEKADAQGLTPQPKAQDEDTDREMGEAVQGDLEMTPTHATAIGRTMTGVEVRRRTTREGGKDKQVFVVGFQGDTDPLNPHNWPHTKRIWITMNVGAIAWIVGFSSSVDSGALQQAAAEFGVSEVTESLATALFLIAFGCGGLVAGPFSEEFGRNPIYIATMLGFMVFVMASALAPNIGAQLAFRYIAGFFASTPLTCAGGSISDLFNPMERVYAFPIFATAAFMGPIFGPVVGGFIAESNVTWRWTEWVSLIVAAAITFSLVLTVPETYTPVLLKYKAQQLRKITGDDRYVAPAEIKDETFFQKIRRALYRPFLILFREPIVLVFALYITIIYIILFTFLNGYTFVFTMTYGISQGITGLCFLGIIIGLACCLFMVPLIGYWYKQDLARAKERNENSLPPEFRLWFSIFGAPAVPISMFWMGWTARPGISIWSPLAASVLFGYGILTIFISCYQYLIDSYELFAASALASITVVRYVAAGGMVVVAIPMYGNLSVEWTLTLLGCLSVLMVPTPYLLYRYGRKIRGWSRYAVVT